MKLLYQTTDKNCMQTAVASLLDLEISKVPDFSKTEHPNYEEYKFLLKRGYDIECTIYNTNVNKMEGDSTDYTDDFNVIKEMDGIDGYFYGVVMSPKFYNPKLPVYDQNQIHHAVIIDKHLNIVNPIREEYKNIDFPLSDKIGYNGILYIMVIGKIK